MNALIMNVVTKTAPVLKKWGPIALAGAAAVIEALDEQKAAKKLLDMEKRIADLEKLGKN